MSELRFSVLSGLAIEHDGKDVADELTALKAQALLVYLAVTAKPHSRQALAGLLWTDVLESSARASLRTVLSQVRKAVGDHVLADLHAIWLDRERPHWVDAHVFEEACRQLQTEVPAGDSARRALREAVNSYGEGFLAGFPETDAAFFEEWVLQQRELYRRLALDALQQLAADALERNDLQPGIGDVRRALVLDPLREEAHRLLMELHAASGNTVEALRQYEQCVRVLDDELGVPPGAETVGLANALKEGRWKDRDRESREQPVRPRYTEVAVAELPPAELSISPFANDLPTALTPFVGRHSELAMLDELLVSDDVHLLSIVGPGGIGKTRLSLTVAVQQVSLHHFPQGVHFTELASLDDPEQIVNAIAKAVALPSQSGSGDRRTPKQRLLAYLRGKEMLLVLDNIEHLLQDVDLIAEILQAAPAVKILATSRERLRLPGEQVFPLYGLDFVGEDTLDADSYPAAIQLFLQSAQRIAPDFSLSDEHLAQIAEICRLVEGMPLGIELAASWVELLSPQEIIDELQNSLDFLVTEQRSVPARHRSMRAVFESTWRQLATEEQALVAGLSIFRGGFTRVASQRVVGATLQQLVTLSGKSLIRLDRKRNRYAIHELVRQYGAERLAEQGDLEEEIRANHSIYFCGIAQQRGEDLRSERQMGAVEELEQEAENLRVAWQWAVSQHDWKLLGQAMDGLGFFYEWQGRFQEGQAAFHIAIDALRATEDHDTQILLGQALTWHSVFDHMLGANLEADERLSEALDILDRESTDDIELLEKGAFAWLRRGIQAYNRDTEAARHGFARSLCLYQRSEHKWGIAQSLRGLGQVGVDDGNYAVATTHFREAIELLREIGDRRSEAQALHHFATAQWFVGSFEEAMQLARRSHRLDTEIGDRVGLAWSNQIMGEILWTTGALEESLTFLAEAEALAEELGDSSRLANVYHIQSLVLDDTGKYREAREKVEAALVLARRLDESARIAWCQLILSSFDLQDESYDEAEQRLQESERLFESQNRGPELAVVLGAQAMTAYARHNRERGLRRTLASLRLSLQHHDYRVGFGLCGLVLVLADAGRIVDALAVFEFVKDSDAAGKQPLRYMRQRWLEPAIGQISPEEIEAAKARYQDTDLWMFVEEWVAELERMAEAGAGSSER